MSRQLGMDCINCRETPRPGHTEYSMHYHTNLIGTIADYPKNKRSDPVPADILQSTMLGITILSGIQTMDL